MRPAPRSPGTSEVRNEAKRGPRSIDDGRRAFGRPHGLNQVGRGRGGQRRVERVGFEPNDQARCRPATPCAAWPARRRASGGRARPAASIRPATRGTRMSPREISRDGFRSSRRDPERGRQRTRHEIDGNEPRARPRAPEAPAARSAGRRRTPAPGRATARSSAARRDVSPPAARVFAHRRARRAAPDRRARTSPGRRSPARQADAALHATARCRVRL